MIYARLAAAAVIALALAAGAWKAYSMGKATVRAEWNAERLEQQQAALRLIEQRDRKQDELDTKARKADHAYQLEKTRRAAADRVADGLRSTLASALDRAASEDTRTPAGIDATDPRPAIAGECVGQLVALDKAYGRLVDQTRALQEYAGSVCVAP